jgi:hypothetical protein
MRTVHYLSSACLLVLILSVAGCYESLTSIVTPDKLIAIDSLAGDYKAVDSGLGRLTIEKGDGKTGVYRQLDDKGSVRCKGTFAVVKLGADHFYQMTVDGFATADGRPVYLIGRLHVEGPAGARTLTGYSFKTPQALLGDGSIQTSEYDYREGAETKKRHGISTPTADLQAFLAKRGGEMTTPSFKFKQAGRAG